MSISDAPGRPGATAWVHLAFLRLTGAMVERAERDARGSLAYVRGYKREIVQSEAVDWLAWLRAGRAG